MLSTLAPMALSLSTLFGASAPPDADRPEPPAPTVLSAVCADVRAEQACVAPELDDTGCTCTVHAELPRAALERGQGGLITGAVALRVAGTSPEAAGMIDTVHLVLRVTDRWVDFGEVASGYEPGAFGIHNEGRVAAIKLVTAKNKLAKGIDGTGALVWVETENHHADSDMGMNAVTTNDVNAVLVCGQVATRVACVELRTDVTDGLGRILDNEPAPPVADYGKVGKVHWSRTVTPAGDGRITLAPAKGKAPPALRTSNGTHTLAALLALLPAGDARDPLAPPATPTPR